MKHSNIKCSVCLEKRPRYNFRRGMCCRCYQKQRYADPAIRERILELDRIRKANLDDAKTAADRARSAEWAKANPDRVKAYKAKYQAATRRVKRIENGTRLVIQVGDEQRVAYAIDVVFRMSNRVGEAPKWAVPVMLDGKLTVVLTSSIVKRSTRVERKES